MGQTVTTGVMWTGMENAQMPHGAPTVSSSGPTRLAKDRSEQNNGFPENDNESKTVERDFLMIIDYLDLDQTRAS